MSAASMIAQALASGVEIVVDGTDLVLNADAPPPAELLDVIATWKADIVRELRLRADPHSEARSIARWISRNWVRSAPGRCQKCGEVERRGTVILPFGTEAIGHVWVHSDCWPAWREWLEAKAVSSRTGEKNGSPSSTTHAPDRRGRDRR